MPKSHFQIEIDEAVDPLVVAVDIGSTAFSLPASISSQKCGSSSSILSSPRLILMLERKKKSLSVLRLNIRWIKTPKSCFSK